MVSSRRLPPFLRASPFLGPLHLSHLFPVPRRCSGPAAISPHGLRNFGKLRSNSRLRLFSTQRRQRRGRGGRGARRRIRGFYEGTVVIGPRYDFLAIIEKAIKKKLQSGGSHAVEVTGKFCERVSIPMSFM